MSISLSDLSFGRRWIGGCLAIWLCVAMVSACSSEAPAPQVQKADNAQVGTTLQAEGWAITLLEPPELTKKVGSGTAVERTDMGEFGGGQTGIREAEGIWLVLSVTATNNTGDLGMLPKRLLKVTDAQGGEHQRAGIKIIAPLIWADERWEGQMQNQLIDYVFEVGGSRDGPLAFDVPEGATGLTLVMEGTDETIDLGF